MTATTSSSPRPSASRRCRTCRSRSSVTSDRHDRAGADPRPDRPAVGRPVAQGRRSSRAPARPTSSIRGFGNGNGNDRHRKLGRRVHRRRLSLALGRRARRPARDRAHRSAARTAIDAVRQERVGRRDQHRHQEARSSNGAARPRSASAITADQAQGHDHRPDLPTRSRSACRAASTSATAISPTSTTGSDVNDSDRWSVRGDLLFEPSSDFSIRIIADYNKINEVCCGAVTIFNGPATQFIGAPSRWAVGKPVSDPSRHLRPPARLQHRRPTTA